MDKKDIFYWLEGIDEQSYNKVKDYINNLQQQLHQASLDIQELTERDIECPSWCDKLTNLQQENERLKKANEILEENWLSYMKICGKAIEYIKEIQESENNINPYILHAPTLLNILQGSDKEC